MQLEQLQQQVAETDLPKYEEIFPESANRNNSVQIYVIRSDQQQQQQQQQQQISYQHHQLLQQEPYQQQPIEQPQLNDSQLSTTTTTSSFQQQQQQQQPQPVKELNRFVYQQQLYHLQNVPQQSFLSYRQQQQQQRQQQQQQQQLPLVHQVQRIARKQMSIVSPATLP